MLKQRRLLHRFLYFIWKVKSKDPIEKNQARAERIRKYAFSAKRQRHIIKGSQGSSWMNSPIPSLLLPRWKNESLCETIGMKICHQSVQNCHLITEVGYSGAELLRAKRASEEPWVMEIGNPSSRENLVMTSAYDQASERRPYRLWGWRRGVSR